MAHSKAEKEAARRRIAEMQDRFLELFTGDSVSRADLDHYAFTSMAFGSAAAVERCLADLDPKFVDLRRDILVSFAYYALSQLVK